MKQNEFYSDLKCNTPSTVSTMFKKNTIFKMQPLSSRSNDGKIFTYPLNKAKGERGGSCLITVCRRQPAAGN